MWSRAKATPLCEIPESAKVGSGILSLAHFCSAARIEHIRKMQNRNVGLYMRGSLDDVFG